MSVGEWSEGPTSETDYYRFIGFAEEDSREFFGENLVLKVEELPMAQGTKWVIELIKVNGPEEDEFVFQVERELEEAAEEFVEDVKAHVEANNGFDREQFAEDHKL